MNSPDIQKTVAKDPQIKTALLAPNVLMYAQIMVACSIAAWVISSPGIWKGKKWGFWIRVVMDVATLVGGSAYLFSLKIPELQKVSPVDLIAGGLSGLMPAAYCFLRVVGVLGPKPS